MRKLEVAACVERALKRVGSPCSEFALKQVAMVVTAIYSTLLPAIPAVACTCTQQEVLWDDRLPIVFDAEIVGTDLTSSRSDGMPAAIVRYKTVEQFRGGDRPKELRTVLDTGACGVRVMPGDRWLIHTTIEGWLHLCATRRIYPSAEKDRALLDQYRQKRSAIGK
jgi:hypothetical protein